jgi:apolipoprotein N-acyltransferase
MKTERSRHVRDRLWWLWLLVGSSLLAIGSMQTVVPLASWLAPVFLMRAVRAQRAVIVLPTLALAGYLASLFAIRGFWPTPELYTLALAGVAIVAVFGADKALSRQLSGFPRTLVYPLADTTFSFLVSNGDFATMGHAAYTQVTNLPLLQLASITGIWGIGFLLNWFASVVNELWENGFEVHQNRPLVTAYATVLAVVVLAGSLRLAFFAPSSPTVRVAALAPNRELNEAYAAAGILAQERTPAERASLRTLYMDPLFADLFARTREAAAGGAEIVVWSEASGFMFKEDEADLLEQARTAAQEAGVYLQMTPVFILPRTEYPFVEIRAILVDPEGAIVWDYLKATQPFGDGNATGQGILPVVDTPYGRLSTAICFDGDFPALIRQAGRAGTDIFLLPVSDWEPIAEMHARMAVPRAVENGMAVIRPARQGTSLAVDDQGRLLAYKPDYFTGDDHTMIVNVPIRGTRTLYTIVGDSFAYLSAAGFAVVAAAALLRRRASLASRQAGIATPGLPQERLR